MGEWEPKRMIRWHFVSILAVFCALAAGCGKRVNDQDAIRASIEKHLTGRADLNLAAMDREVKQVTVNGDHATAEWIFVSREVIRGWRLNTRSSARARIGPS